MPRRDFTKATKAKAFKRANGKCEGCQRPLEPGRFAFDHIRADGLQGEPTLENCQVLCSGGKASCHHLKTQTVDLPPMRKADAQRNALLGITGRKAKIPAPPKAPKREPKPMPPRRPLYGDIDNG
jgi:5-methylcytosine-specific restriction protein A